jgi:hypothetical protein
MKTRLPTVLAACALYALPLSTAQAQNLVLNGDFQTGKSEAFHSTPGWYNRGTGLNQGTNARTELGSPGLGAFAATINDRYDAAQGKFGPLAHFQKTGHTIQAGDAFKLSYQWRPFDDFWQKSRDTVRFVLYATQDDRGGSPVVWSATFDSDFFTGSIISMKDVTQTTEVVSLAAVGKKLLICFFGLDTVDGVNGSSHFARVDNIVITLQSATK